MDWQDWQDWLDWLGVVIHRHIFLIIFVVLGAILVPEASFFWYRWLFRCMGATSGAPWGPDVDFR